MQKQQLRVSSHPSAGHTRLASHRDVARKTFRAGTPAPETPPTRASVEFRDEAGLSIITRLVSRVILSHQTCAKSGVLGRKKGEVGKASFLCVSVLRGDTVGMVMPMP